MVSEFEGLAYTVITTETPATSPAQHTAFWLPFREAEVYVAAQNTSDKPLDVSLLLTGTGGSVTLTRSLGPRESTALVSMLPLEHPISLALLPCLTRARLGRLMPRDGWRMSTLAIQTPLRCPLLRSPRQVVSMGRRYGSVEAGLKSDGRARTSTHVLSCSTPPRPP